MSCPYKLARSNRNFTITLYAGEGIGYDYSVVTTTVTVQEASNNTVEFLFYSDSIAQEPNESFTLRLEVAGGSTLPMGDGVFVVDEINMVIMDNDSKADGKVSMIVISFYVLFYFSGGN